MMKKYDDAVATYQEALGGDPNNAEAREGISRTKMGERAGMSQEERAAEAMKDPEIQAILSDPVIRQILEQMQKDPTSAQSHMQNPEIAAKIMKLVEGGIL